MSAAQLPTGHIVQLLPKVWVGYLIAATFLMAEIGEVVIDPSSIKENASPLLHIIAMCGGVYWLYCVYRMHKVIAAATDSLYPVTPGKAVGYSFIPVFNLYWLFKWTNEITHFVNARYPGPKMRKGWTGFFLLIGLFLGRWIDSAVGLAIIFSVGEYLAHKIGYAIEYEQGVCPVQNLPDIEHWQRWNITLAGGLGCGFGLLLYTALDHVFSWDMDHIVQFIVAGGIMLIFSVKFLHPLIERLHLLLGLQADHPMTEPEQSRPLRMTIVFVFVGLLYEMSHSLIHEVITTGGILPTAIKLVTSLLISGAITYCWTRGVGLRPPQAAKLGALSGMLMGGIFIILAWLMGGLENVLNDKTVGMIVIMNGLSWGIVGFAGGLAINRAWGKHPSQGVMLTMTAAVLLLDVPLALLGLAPLMEGLMQDFLRAVGWGLGLTLHPSTNRMLNVHRRYGDSFEVNHKDILMIDVQKLQNLGASSGLLHSKVKAAGRDAQGRYNRKAALYARDNVLDSWARLQQMVRNAALAQKIPFTPTTEISRVLERLEAAKAVSKVMAQVIAALHEEGTKIADHPDKKMYLDHAIIYLGLVCRVEDWLRKNALDRDKPIPEVQRRTQAGDYFPPPAIGKPTVILRGVSGPLQQQQFSVEKMLFRIGANPENDLVIAGDSFVSGSHASLRFVNGILTITDQDSLNGTYLNNSRVKDVPLTVNAGDRIRLGQSTLEVVVYPRR